MTAALSPRAMQLLGAIRRNFELLGELEKTAPHEVDVIVAAMVQHLRAWKPRVTLTHLAMEDRHV